MHKQILALLIGAITLVSSTPASAGTNGSWRRWPWRNGQVRVLTQVEEHGYASSSARKAIDIALNYEAVHSVGPGSVLRISNSSLAGNYLQVENDDGTVTTYEHLSSFDTTVGKEIFIGDLIAVSGNSGNSRGPHLHVQRSKTSSFNSEAKTLVPIDGNYDPYAGQKVRSGNAGIGTDSGNRKVVALRQAYKVAGGWSSVGAPQLLSPTTTPCWTKGRSPTRWMYPCASGFVQTFEKDNARSIIVGSAEKAFVIADGFAVAAAATDPWGQEYLFAIGLPLGSVSNTGSYLFQPFENGYMYRPSGSCWVSVYVNGWRDPFPVWVC